MTDMLTIDESEWPLVVVRWHAPVCGCDMARYRERFAHWLRHPRFALVSVLEAPVLLPNRALRDMADWMNARRALIAARCTGIASVLPSALLDETRFEDFRHQASLQVGCPARAFSGEAQAIQWAWLRLQAAPASPPGPGNSLGGNRTLLH